MTDVGPQPADPERALVEAIASLDDVDPASVAGLLDDRLDATVSSRSSHDDPDPNGRIGSNLDATISSRAVPEDSVDWASKTPQTDRFTVDSASTDGLSVSGSGFIVGVTISSAGGINIPRITVDGVDLLDDGNIRQMGASFNTSSDPRSEWDLSMSLIWRFDEGFSAGSSYTVNDDILGEVAYVLD